MRTHAIRICLVTFGLLLFALTPGPLYAQSCTAEVEPNDQPAAATPISGADCITGTETGEDQDLFVWTISATDAQQIWQLAFHAMPYGVSGVQLLKIEFADNGKDVTNSTKLFELSSPDGQDVNVDQLLLTPGTYYLGIIHSGAGGAYQLDLQARGPLPAPNDSEPNDDADNALALPTDAGGAAIKLSGNLNGSEDWYAWTLSDQAAQQRWQVRALVPLGEQVTLAIEDADHNQILSQDANERGQIDFGPLGLAAGSYYLRLSPAADHSLAYQLTLTAAGERSLTREEEPDNDLATAYALDPAQSMQGSFPAVRDHDYYSFTVDDAFAQQQWAVNVTVATLTNTVAPTVELCLYNATGEQLQCRQSTTPVLPDLILQPGSYLLALSNLDSTAADYTIEFAQTGTPSPTQEAEPNDAITTASPLSQASVIRGQFVGDEDDYYRFTVSGEPQLWRVQAVGNALDFMSYQEIDGSELVRQSANGARLIRIDNLYLLPGDHFLRLHGKDSHYTIRLIPLGPPAVTPTELTPATPVTTLRNEPTNTVTTTEPGPPLMNVTEHEPNNDESRAEPLAFGQLLSGVLSVPDDHDVYRFSLSGVEHIRLTVTPPPDGQLQIDLLPFFFNGLREPGVSWSYETVLGPGDYYVGMDTTQPSRDPYTILLERLNPLVTPVDLEPFNNDRKTAAGLPPTLHVAGAVNTSEDPRDWYQLPVVHTATPITLSTTPTAVLELWTLDDSLSLTVSNQTAGLYGAELPADLPVYVGVSGNTAYTLAVTFDGGPQPAPEPATLPVSLTLRAPVTAAAGFWHQAQQLDLTLTLTNTSKTTQALSLTLASSDFAWTPKLAQNSLALAAGETRTVPVQVDALPDLSTDSPVRFSVSAASTATYAPVATTFELPAVCGVDPVHANASWTTAGALRGGLNLAWTGLGALPINDKANDHIFDLFDEIVSPAFGWRGAISDTLTVQLAGDGAVPVAGVLINPQGRTLPWEQVRSFDVLLSQDGQQFDLVYSGEVAQAAVEQAFVFTQPLQARFAQLRLRTNWQANGDIGVGEFKVIAPPGWTPPSAPGFNLLDPAHGGHVIVTSPLVADDMQKIVTPKLEQPSVEAEAGQPIEWVVGFHHNRAAQITKLQWLDAPDAKSAARLPQVEVQVSLDSPVGPWQPLATWTLNVSATVTQTLALPAPVWARYVRFVASSIAEKQTIFYPDQLSILERTADSASPNGYQSILAEWGGYQQAAIYEAAQANAAPANPLTEVADNNSVTHAQPLQADQLVRGSVLVGKDEDWFSLTVPPNQNTLQVTLSGDPVVAVAYELLDSAGAPVTYTTSDVGHRVELTATVTPGVYHLHIRDPKRSVVFTWDTSGSVGPYLAATYQSLASFARDIDPELEVINLLPFGDPGQYLLKDWSGNPVNVLTALTNYPRTDSSSSAEANLLQATTALGQRPGTRAIMLMTDAESSSYPQTAALWQALAQSRPRIFSFEISTGGAVHSQDLMQDWAAVNNGHYENMATIGTFENGFARATCLLRRPALYELQVAYSEQAPPPTPTPAPTATPTATPTPFPTATPEPTATSAAPGSLTVIGQTGASGIPTNVVGGGAIELILDASGSMLQRIEGKSKIQIALDVLTNLTSNILPKGAPLALRVFGHREADSCRTDLEVPLQPLDPPAINTIINGIAAKNLAKTPIADSLRLVAQDLAGANGQKVVILVTDGEETCGGDPAAEIKSLRAQGIDVRINIVGFDVDDAALKATFAQWAELGGGFYFNASNAKELDAAVANALRAPFRVLDANGALIASGIVNGDPINLPAGVYTVEVLTEPVRRFEQVKIEGGQPAQLTVNSTP
ncbi:MAG: VWA domain-containing protein [Chloroflexi bacterium]|nr:VWA domain-containing protein [Chloroflexota bacterium]